MSTVHGKLRPHKCIICLKTFPLERTLRGHIQTQHDTVKEEFECLICTSRFPYQSFLKDHIETVHDNLRPWQCSQCKQSLKTNKHLLLHIKTVHSIKNQNRQL